MNPKYVVAGAVGLFALGFASGHYALPTKVTKTETVVEYRDRVDTSKIVSTTTQKPDGTKITVTEVDKHVTTDTQINKSEQSVTSRSSLKWSMAALATTTISSPSTITYGAEVTYQILGPISVGAMGLSNGTIGLSLGVRF